MQDMAEAIAAEEARLRDKGIFKRLPDPDRVAEHLAAAEEPKWGLDRRRAINRALADRPPGDNLRFEVLSYVRNDCRASNMQHFFDHIAAEEDVRHVERILGL
jgi:hypothetical protein